MCVGWVKGQGSPQHIKAIIYDAPCKYEQMAFDLDLRIFFTIWALFTLVKILPFGGKKQGNCLPFDFYFPLKSTVSYFLLQNDPSHQKRGVGSGQHMAVLCLEPWTQWTYESMNQWNHEPPDWHIVGVVSR